MENDPETNVPKKTVDDHGYQAKLESLRSTHPPLPGIPPRDDFRTVAIFTFPSEMATARTLLECEDIECRVLDEHTVHSHHFISHAVGGIKLQVRESDYSKASALLKEQGIVPDLPAKPNALERLFQNAGFQKGFRLVLYALLLIAAALFIPFVVVPFFNPTSDLDRIVKERWCLDHILYDEEVFYPNTLEKGRRVKIILNHACEEELNFKGMGEVHIPGFDSPSFTRNWKLLNDSIYILPNDSFPTLFEGVYYYELLSDELILTSDSLKIYCVHPSY